MAHEQKARSKNNRAVGNSTFYSDETHAFDSKSLVEVRVCDILELRTVDVLVCPTSRNLYPERPLAKKVWKRAGDGLDRYLGHEREKGNLEVGEVRLTPGFDLLNSYERILHVYLPDRGNERQWSTDLGLALETCFETLGEAADVRSVAVPVFGKDVASATVLIDKLSLFIASNRSKKAKKLKKVFLVTKNSCVAKFLEDWVRTSLRNDVSGGDGEDGSRRKETPTGSESESKNESESKSKNESESKSKSESESKNKSESNGKSESKSDSESESRDDKQGPSSGKTGNLKNVESLAAAAAAANGYSIPVYGHGVDHRDDVPNDHSNTHREYSKAAKPDDYSDSAEAGIGRIDDGTLERRNRDEDERVDVTSDTKKDEKKDEDKDEEEDKCCPICFDDFTPTNRRKLSGCEHSVCPDCLDRLARANPLCPICRKAFGAVTGDQPTNACMSEQFDKRLRLPGYDNCTVIVINYNIPSGTQTAEHPKPGSRYHGTSRLAYLPDNAEGRKVLELLRKAFNARLTFTVGRSITTGMDNVITWNDIHHKTSVHGGPEGYGYPDPTYLSRVTEDLAAKGIV